MTVNILGTEYEILIQNDNPKMKDSDGFCEWLSKKIIITDSYRTDEDALENIDEYIHKVIRHEAFHALFAEMGIKKWLHDEELIDMLAMQYPKIKKIMDKCDGWDFGNDEPQTNADQHVERVEYVGNDGKCRCWKCRHFKSMHQTPISSDGRHYNFVVCTASKCRYEPKDESQTEAWQDWKDRMWAEAIVTEPQTETEIAKTIVHKMIDDAVIAEDVYPDLRQKMHDAVDEYEPQTETQIETKNSNSEFEKTDCQWK